MAFSKTGVSVTVPRAVPISRTEPEIGEEKDGQVWDGLRWVPKPEWESRQTKG
jgi:hypothetical protein